MAQSLKKDFLEVPEIPVEVFSVRSEGEDRVAHQLPGPVVGNVSPSPHVEELNPPALSFLVGEKDVIPQGGGPKGDDIGVFQKEELVRYLPLPPSGHQLCLQIQSLSIGDPAEFSNFNRRETLLRHLPGIPP